MLECNVRRYDWAHEPQNRPSFNSIHRELVSMKEEATVESVTATAAETPATDGERQFAPAEPSNEGEVDILNHVAPNQNNHDTSHGAPRSVETSTCDAKPGAGAESLLRKQQGAEVTSSGEYVLSSNSDEDLNASPA